MGRIINVVGVVLGVLIAMLIVLGLLVETGFVPSDRVLTHDDLPVKQLETLIQAGILETGERVELFYSEGLVSVTEGGSILTDRRVIAYDGDSIYDIAIDELASIELVQEGDFLNFAVYRVYSKTEDGWLELWLPHEHGDAERFANAVRAGIGAP